MCKHLVGQDTTAFNYFEEIKKYDLSGVFKPDSVQDDAGENHKWSDPLGFIDTNFQRFQIHFITIIKSFANPYEYEITGKTKVNDHICSFNGTIKVVSAIIKKSKFDGFPSHKWGYIIGQIQINENKSQPASGNIKGRLTAEFLIDDKGIIKYNGLSLIADGFRNNLFEGTWTSYLSGKSKKCNWGDGRIPDSGNLDYGVSVFIPNVKYLDYGWRNYYNSIIGFMDDPIKIEAERIERLEWWK
jgi:hypothetical protein